MNKYFEDDAEFVEAIDAINDMLEFSFGISAGFAEFLESVKEFSENGFITERQYETVMDAYDASEQRPVNEQG